MVPYERWTKTTLMTPDNLNNITKSIAHDTTQEILADVQVGKRTAYGGEVFNDYEYNRALAKFTRASGRGCTAGATGWKLVSDVTLIPESNQASFRVEGDARALSQKVISFEGQSHFTNQLLVVAAVYTDEHTELTVTATNRDTVLSELDGFTIQQSPDETSEYTNWVWCVELPLAGYDASFSTAASAEGFLTTAIGLGATAFGINTKALGNYSFTEGIDTLAYYGSHAEGGETQSIGYRTHTEGHRTVASGTNAHAEGEGGEYGTLYPLGLPLVWTAQGRSSHVEGYQCATTPDALGAHAGGLRTIAASPYQLVIGRYNIVDGKRDASGKLVDKNGDVLPDEVEVKIGQNTYLVPDFTRSVKNDNSFSFIIGCGTNHRARANAATVDWSGNAWFAGNITLGANKDEVATKGYLNSEFTLPISKTTGDLDPTRLASAVPVAKGGTGASTLAKAADSIGAYTLYEPTTMSSGSLNDKTTPGSFRITSSASANVTGKPKKQDGTEIGGYCVLRVFRINTRTLTSGTSFYIGQELRYMTTGAQYYRYGTPQNDGTTKWDPWLLTLQEDRYGDAIISRNLQINGSATMGGKAVATEEYVREYVENILATRLQ